MQNEKISKREKQRNLKMRRKGTGEEGNSRRVSFLPDSILDIYLPFLRDGLFITRCARAPDEYSSAV